MVSRPSLRPTLPLTARQRQILQLIARWLRDHGLPPTRADLAQALGLANRQGIDQHLRALQRKGYLALTPGAARGVRLLQSPADSATADAAATPAAPPASAAPARLLRLPLYGRVAAGAPTLASDNVEDEISIDAALFRPRADFLLRVHGHSMRDADILDGDILAVHRTPTARNGQVVVARLGDEATVKYYEQRGPLLRLLPANPAFRPIEVDLREQACVIEGLAVGIVRASLPHRPAASR